MWHAADRDQSHAKQRPSIVTAAVVSDIVSRPISGRTWQTIGGREDDRTPSDTTRDCIHQQRSFACVDADTGGLGSGAEAGCGRVASGSDEWECGDGHGGGKAGADDADDGRGVVRRHRQATPPLTPVTAPGPPRPVHHAPPPPALVPSSDGRGRPAIAASHGRRRSAHADG